MSVTSVMIGTREYSGKEKTVELLRGLFFHVRSRPFDLYLSMFGFNLLVEKKRT